MAQVRIKWIDNGVGLWKSEDGEWGIFPESNGYHRLQRKSGPDPWDWEVVDHLKTFEDAAKLATEITRRKWA